MYTFRKFRKVLIAASTVAALAGLSRSAAADQVIYSPFTIDPNALTSLGCTLCGPLVTAISADNIVGVYQEQTILTAATATTGTFTSTATGEVGAFYTGPSGTTPVCCNTGVSGSPYSAGDYGLYATFTSDGTYTLGGTNTFTGTSGTVTLWLDPTANDTFNVSGVGAPAVLSGTGASSGNAADVSLGSSSFLIDGVGQEVGASDGSYNLTFGAFGLTAAGLSYFTAPVPFYTISILTGNFQNFAPVFAPCATAVATCATIQTSGSFQDTFSPVPEPASLTLLGVGLLAGYRRMRRKTVL